MTKLAKKAIKKLSIAMSVADMVFDIAKEVTQIIKKQGSAAGDTKLSDLDSWKAWVSENMEIDKDAVKELFDEIKNS